VILREPANALDPRMRTYWTVEGVIATVVVGVLVAAGAVIAALLGSATTAWLLGGLGGLAVVILGVLAVFTARLDYRHFR